METLSGKITAFNISPKGSHESFLLDISGKTVQVNLPKEAGADAAKSYKIGKTCKVTVNKFKSDKPSKHPVYDLADVANEAPREGVVASINYARHGEPNGVVLESGEFIHLKPEGAKLANLKTGKKITFEGKSLTSPDGFTVIEATKINGESLKPKKP